MAKHKAPGKSFRSGLSLIQIMDLIPDGGGRDEMV